MEQHARLFFALVPPDDLALQLNRLAAGEKKVTTEKLTRTGMMHMTLRYIGQADDSVRQCLLSAKLFDAVTKFQLQLDITGYWKRSRILWCGPDKTNDALRHLQQQLEKTCQQCGLKAESRSFKAHVTLLKNAGDYHRRSKVALSVWPVNHFVLLASISTEQGVIYKELKRWPLK
ncbi:MAG: RNA 2',3'-cyclic phosphodiesterase [Gammaproteobacteria bacterium]|nr:RNA 2',3'-cyclic phosphodiesterase [Gammaproteobacteria bacterium]